MKKIYPFLKNKFVPCIASFFLMSSNAFGQICGPVMQNFQNTSGSTAGFTGDFTLGTQGQASFLEKRNPVSGAVYTITSPTYQLPNNATSIGYGFILDGTEKVGNVRVSIMYISTVTNQLTTVALASFTPTYGTGSAASTSDVCRAVQTSELSGFPTGGSYRIRIEITPVTGTGANNQNVTFDDFRTNGTLSQAPLPVNFLGFEARKVGNGVQLTWKVAGEENVNRYEVERSEDGRKFTTIASVATHGKDTYTYTDASNISTAFYRIKNVDNDSKFRYSDIARIANGRNETVLRAFPQPAQGQLTLQHPAISGKAVLSLSTADGRVVRSLSPANGSLQTFVDLSGLQKGMYLLRFNSGDGQTQTMKVVKQ